MKSMTIMMRVKTVLMASTQILRVGPTQHESFLY